MTVTRLRPFDALIGHRRQPRAERTPCSQAGSALCVSGMRRVSSHARMCTALRAAFSSLFLIGLGGPIAAADPAVSVTVVPA